jgi:hypothetical protein
MAATKAFIASFTQLSNDNLEVYESYPARLLRYAIAESFYDGTQYKQSFSQGMKKDGGLYKYIRNIYNFILRDIDFWQAAIWRGGIDPYAGEDGAIPIEVSEELAESDEQLRAAIAQVWKHSNWDIKKDTLVMRGALLGDAAQYIRDDMERGQVRIELIHPALIKHVKLDAMGYVKEYEIEEIRLDEKLQKALYRETAERGTGEEVIFKTYRNNVPYAWDGNKDRQGNPRSEWVESYGFIPLVMTQHINFDADFGRSEVHSVFDKITQVNDIASMLADSIRKTVDPFLFANFNIGDSALGFSTPAATTDNPEPGREQKNILSVDDRAATLTPITPSINIADIGKIIADILEEAKDDLPEINETIYSNVATDTVLAARARVISKVEKRRAAYDADHVRALQMCIAISGMRGYDGFEGYDLNSYADGRLDFRVAKREVFPEAEDTKTARRILLWQTAADVTQKTQGQIPAEAVLIDLGMTTEDLGLTDETVPSLPTARMNAIRVQQEDTIPEDGQ